MKTGIASLTTKSLAELVKRVLGISKKEAYVMVLNHPMLVKLMAVADDYLVVFDKKTFSGKGKIVAKADLLRDNLFNGMKYCLYGYTLAQGLVTQQNALDLYSYFEARGLDLYRYKYDDESAQLDKLIEDLEKPGNKAKIELLHLTELYNLMKTAQYNFELNFGEQTAANAELRNMESATSLQNALTIVLRNYLNFVDVMSSMDQSWTLLNSELKETVKAALNSKQSPTSIPPAPAN